MVVLLACKRDHYEIDPPAYIRIDSFIVSNTCFPENQDRPEIGSQKVTDAWVFVDGTLQGVYELPVTFPVTEEGTHRIEIKPGILKNGISATRAIYPFYESYSQSVTLNSTEAVHINPCLAYLIEGERNDDIQIIWEEDFEGVVDFQYHIDSDTTITVVSKEEDVFQGNFSGGIFLTEKEHFFELISPQFKNLPTNGTPIYLELNYRTNHDFFVGLYYQGMKEQINLYGFRPRDSWNKVYIDLSEPIRLNGNSPDFNIFIGFVKDADIDTVNMFIDNIKLLHF